MANQKKAAGNKLGNALTKLSERVLSYSDAELDEELRASGKDPKEVVESMRSQIAGLIASNRKGKLVAARSAMEQERKAQRTKPWHLLVSAIERRELLDKVIQSSQQMPEPLTALFRDRGTLSDSDIEGILNDLGELGYLANFIKDQ